MPPPAPAPQIDLPKLPFAARSPGASLAPSASVPELGRKHIDLLEDATKTRFRNNGQIVDTQPPAVPKPLGRPGLNQFLAELQGYAEAEMKARDCPKQGYSESRLNIWREVIEHYSARMASSQMLLSRVQHEYDTAINSLLWEIKAAEREVTKAFKAQERAQVAAAKAKLDAQQQVKRILAQIDEKEAMRNKRELENSRSKLNVEVVMGSINALAEQERRDCLSRVVETQETELRNELLLRFLLRLQDAERSSIFALLMQPRKTKLISIGMSMIDALKHVEKPMAQQSAPEDGEEGEDGDGESQSPNFREAEAESAAIEVLLDALPERLRSKLGVIALGSLRTEVRIDALAELRESVTKNTT